MPHTANLKVLVVACARPDTVGQSLRKMGQDFLPDLYFSGARTQAMIMAWVLA